MWPPPRLPDADVMRQLAVVLDYLPTILAGHGIDLGGSSRDGSGDYDVAGLSLPWILAATALTLVTVGLLVWLNPSSRVSRKLRNNLPEAGLIAVLVVTPLVVWNVVAESAGNSPSLIVERVAVGLNGGPEFLVSLGEDDLNTLKTTNGRKVVRVECVGPKGQLVFAAKADWPFGNESGYDYPHVHQPASRDKLRIADQCRLRGTRIRLQADVKGTLSRY